MSVGAGRAAGTAGGGRPRMAWVRWEEAAGGGRVWAEFSEAGGWRAGADAGNCSIYETLSWMRLWLPVVSLQQGDQAGLKEKRIKAHLYDASNNITSHDVLRNII